MACPDIITGDRFLERSLAHIDCQAQTIGTYGFQSLSEPGSTASLLVTGLLTIFIALFGIRLLFSGAPPSRDVIGDVIKIGIVLTLAFSWPAFRTVIYDVTLDGPSEIAAAITGDSVPQSEVGFAARLQAADTAIVSLTVAGTGRNTSAFVDDAAENQAFDAAVLEDDSTLGWARLAYLTGVLAPLATVRILGGLLLALAPVVAALLLFEATRGIFSGWLRGLVLVFAGSLGVTVVLAVQLAVLEPWLADAIRVRGLGYATPAAPIEMMTINLAFALASIGLLYILTRVAFQRGWISVPEFPSPSDWQRSEPLRYEVQGPGLYSSRAERLSDHLRTSMRREEEFVERRSQIRSIGQASSQQSSVARSGNDAASNQSTSRPTSGSAPASAAGKTRAGQIRDRLR